VLSVKSLLCLNRLNGGSIFFSLHLSQVLPNAFTLDLSVCIRDHMAPCVTCRSFIHTATLEMRFWINIERLSLLDHTFPRRMVSQYKDCDMAGSEKHLKCQSSQTSSWVFCLEMNVPTYRIILDLVCLQVDGVLYVLHGAEELHQLNNSYSLYIVTPRAL